ncbi:hypothetical protein VTN77DRAFT_4063 [Rasamsonia byssochlamydoides]|uniref:uncharacterized protein n=1 Tax=Rasamsonia byssochlamydoides TaxID=89139 RepID=UPI00374233D1
MTKGQISIHQTKHTSPTSQALDSNRSPNLKSTTLSGVRHIVFSGLSTVNIYYQNSTSKYDVPSEKDEDEEPPTSTAYLPQIRFTLKFLSGSGDLISSVQKDKPIDLKRTPKELPVLELVTTYERRLIGRWNTSTKIREGDIFKSRVLVLHSPLLINAHRSVVEYHSSATLTGPTLRFDEPFRLLVHHKKKLTDYMKMPRPEHKRKYNKECDEHIKLLVEFLDNHFGLSLREEEARWERKIPVTTFENY